MLVHTALTVKTPPASEPVDIAALRAHCRIDASSDDTTLLPIYLATARQMAEQYLGRALLTQTLVSTLRELGGDGGSSFPRTPDGWGWARKQASELPRSPVQSVTSVKLLDSASAPATITLDPTAKAEYFADIATEPARLLIDWGAVSAAETLTFPIQHVQVEFIAGYTNAAAVPAPILHALMAHVMYLYENRGDTVAQMPDEVQALLWPYRILFIGG